MGMQDRDWYRNDFKRRLGVSTGFDSARPLKTVNPWRYEGSGFRLRRLIGFLLTLSAGFVLGAIYGDWALRFIQGFA